MLWPQRGASLGLFAIGCLLIDMMLPRMDAYQICYLLWKH
jgi:hypothetical protein